MKKILFLAFSVIVWNPPLLHGGEESFSFFVKHDHWLGSGHGRLIIDQKGISYRSEKGEKHFRRWSYIDIQQVKIESPTELKILTYEDLWWKLGGERQFEFQVVDGEITPAMVQLLRNRLPTVVVSTVFSEPQDIFYMIPAKHLHTLGGGCEGNLLFGERGIYYSSSNQEHNRFWPLEVIEGLGRQSEFSLRITAREENLLGETRNFQFQLKRRLHDEAYELFWRKVYEPESWLNRTKLEEANPFKAKGIRFEF